MISRRNIFLILILIFNSVGVCLAQTGSVSWNALDIVASSSEKSISGALDMVIESVSPGSSSVESRGNVVSVLSSYTSNSKSVADMSQRAGSVSAEALDFIRKAQNGTGYYSSGAFNSASDYSYSGANYWGGRQIAPSSWGRITSGFGYRPRFGRMHKGVDIALSIGDTVRVPLPGVVDRVSYEAGGYGNYIVVKHDNGFETRYAHLSASMVSVGQYVSAYQPIALSGNTGNSTGPHLHFETRMNGEAIDPRNFFDFSGGRMVARSKASYSTMGSTSLDGIGALDQVRDHSLSGKSLEERRTYVVKAGDTLQKIAGRAGISVKELCRLNMISEREPLKPGVMLRLKH